MNFCALIYFQNLTQTFSDMETANRLGISRPTVSQAICSNEKQLNTTLFTHGDHSKIIALTASGKVLLSSATTILAR